MDGKIRIQSTSGEMDIDIQWIIDNIKNLHMDIIGDRYFIRYKLNGIILTTFSIAKMDWDRIIPLIRECKINEIIK